MADEYRISEAEHVGVSWLRQTKKNTLRELDHIVILHEHAKPVSVLIPYQAYLTIQDAFRILERKTNE